jgi:hypothetical protein
VVQHSSHVTYGRLIIAVLTVTPVYCNWMLFPFYVAISALYAVSSVSTFGYQSTESIGRVPAPRARSVGRYAIIVPTRISIGTNKLRGFSPRANYTDRRLSIKTVPTFGDRKVAPQLYSRAGRGNSMLNSVNVDAMT